LHFISERSYPIFSLGPQKCRKIEVNCRRGEEKSLKIAAMMHKEREKMTFGWASNSAKKF